MNTACLLLFCYLHVLIMKLMTLFANTVKLSAKLWYMTDQAQGFAVHAGLMMSYDDTILNYCTYIPLNRNGSFCKNAQSHKRKV